MKLQNLFVIFTKQLQKYHQKKYNKKGNKFGKSGGLLLASSLSSICRLIQLDLSGNQLGDFTVAKIIDGIASGSGSRTLLKLDLKDNILSFTAGRHLILFCLKI